LRSKSNPPAARLLIVIGRGLAAGFAHDLVWQLQQGGFETRIALSPEADGWAAPETLRHLSGAPILSGDPRPAWADRSEPFAATVGVGLPTSTLADIANGAPRSPAIELLLRRGGPLIFLHEPLPADAAPTLRACAVRGYTLRELPPVPGQWRSAFEQMFADLVLFLSRRNRLQSMRVVVSRTVPEPLISLAGAPPDWKHQLERCLVKLGFPAPSPNQDDEAPLHIETYEGPFPLRKKKGRTETLGITLDPTGLEETTAAPARHLRARFVHPDAPETGVRALAESGWIVVRRQPNGHLIVTESSGDRLIPDVTAQSAFLRFAEFLADRLAHAAG